MYVYVSRKCLRESVERTPQTNKPKLLKKQIELSPVEIKPEIESSVSNTIALISADIKAKRERKRKPMKEWDALFRTKGK
jgi:hypothetical protein